MDERSLVFDRRKIKQILNLQEVFKSVNKQQMLNKGSDSWDKSLEMQSSYPCPKSRSRSMILYTTICNCFIHPIITAIFYPGQGQGGSRAYPGNRNTVWMGCQMQLYTKS